MYTTPLSIVVIIGGREDGPPIFWSGRTDPHFISTPSQKFCLAPLFRPKLRHCLSVPLFLPFPLTIIFMQITISSFSLSTHSILTQAFLTFKTYFNRFLPGWLLIFLLLTSLRLNSCSSDSKTNSPKYTTLHLTLPTLLKIFASSLMNILLSLTKLHLSPSPVTITFVNFVVFCLTSIRQLPVPTTATSIVHFRLDYCNSHKLPKSQLSRL